MVHALIILLLWASTAWATPLTSSYPTSVDTDANLGGAPVAYANTTTTGSTACAAGSLSATSIAVSDATNFDATGGVAAICDNTGDCNLFTYTSITGSTFNGVLDTANGQVTTCTTNYATGASIWGTTTVTTLAARLRILQTAVENSQRFGGIVVAAASLPTAGTVGRFAIVTDGTGTACSGGSTKTPCFDNGVSWEAIRGVATGTVTSVGMSGGSTGLTYSGSPITTSGTITIGGLLNVVSGGTGITSGTSGGLLAFSGSGTLASSVVLPANRIVLGGGAGSTPAPLGSLGTTVTVLHGNAAGAPTFAAVTLTSDVTGTLPYGNGGTGNSAAPLSGQLPIGNNAGFTLATLTGTSNQIVVTNGAGSITLSTPQSIGTGSSPTFAGLTLSGLTQNSVIFAGAGGLLSQDNTNFTFVDSTDTLTAKNVVASTALTDSAMTSGSVLYAGASGVVSQNNANLFWDNSNTRLGVGLNSSFTAKRLETVDAGPTWAGLTTGYDSARFVINGYPTSDEFAGLFSLGVAQALVGAVTVPASADSIAHGAGVAGYAESSSTTMGAVGVFGAGLAKAAGGNIWGANFLVDNRQFAATVLQGIEVDVNNLNTNSATNAYGITIVGASNVQPSGAFDGIVIDPHLDGTKWKVGVELAPGCCDNGVVLNPQATSGAASSGTVLYLSRTSAPAILTGYQLMDSSGNMTISGGSGGGLILQYNGGTNGISLNSSGNTSLAGDLTFASGKNIILSTTTGTKIGTGTTQLLGFYNATPVVQQTRGATTTNNVTAGGTDDTIADFTSLTTYSTDAAAIRNDIYQLARIVRQHDVALRALGLEN